LKCKVVCILWLDHLHVNRSSLGGWKKAQTPTLSIGLIVDETEKALVLASDIERYEERDDVTYTIIYKSAIQSIKEYGSIKIARLKG